MNRFIQKALCAVAACALTLSLSACGSTSPATGDKKAQKFEDEYLDDVIACIKSCGIRAVTYMPTRNTPDQLARLRRLCGENGLFQVSGEDINSPRQSFVIKAMENPLFANLIDATWKLIEHEKTGSAIC